MTRPMPRHPGVLPLLARFSALVDDGAGRARVMAALGIGRGAYQALVNRRAHAAGGLRRGPGETPTKEALKRMDRAMRRALRAQRERFGDAASARAANKCGRRPPMAFGWATARGATSLAEIVRSGGESAGPAGRRGARLESAGG